MRTLLFLSRVALLMNLVFLLFLAAYYEWVRLDNTYIKGLVITVGWGISFLVNLLLHPALLVHVLLRRQLNIPWWILVVNLSCLVLQIIYYFFS